MCIYIYCYLLCFCPTLISIKSSCPSDAQKNEKQKKITVNSGPVMFSGEIYYTDPLILLTKSLVKYSFSLHTLLRY